MSRCSQGIAVILFFIGIIASVSLSFHRVNLSNKILYTRTFGTLLHLRENRINIVLQNNDVIVTPKIIILILIIKVFI